MGLSPEIRFGFAYGLASGVFFWMFGKTLRKQECAIVLGKPGEKRKHCKVS